MTVRARPGINSFMRAHRKCVCARWQRRTNSPSAYYARRQRCLKYIHTPLHQAARSGGTCTLLMQIRRSRERAIRYIYIYIHTKTCAWDYLSYFCPCKYMLQCKGRSLISQKFNLAQNANEKVLTLSFKNDTLL